MRHRVGASSKRKPFVVYHAMLQLSATAVLACGAAAVYLSKEKDMHFITGHSFIGAAALALVSLNVRSLVRSFVRTSMPRTSRPLRVTIITRRL